MIKVTVELLPAGIPSLRRKIGTMEISNVSQLAPRSDYSVDIWQSYHPIAGTPPRSCTVTVRNHERRLSVWRLIHAALSEAKKIGHVDT